MTTTISDKLNGSWRCTPFVFLKGCTSFSLTGSAVQRFWGRREDRGAVVVAGWLPGWYLCVFERWMARWKVRSMATSKYHSALPVREKKKIAVWKSNHRWHQFGCEKTAFAVSTNTIGQKTGPILEDFGWSPWMAHFNPCFTTGDTCCLGCWIYSSIFDNKEEIWYDMICICICIRIRICICICTCTCICICICNVCMQHAHTKYTIPSIQPM